MKRILFYDGIFHSGKSAEDTFRYLAVENGRIVGTYRVKPENQNYDREISLHGRHVYPCLLDSHMHLLLTVVSMALGFSVCEITEKGVEPNTLAGVEEKIRSYAAKQKKDTVITASNYILSAVDKRRLPTREELDRWAGGRPIVVYNIDGHSSAMSTEMLKKIGIEPEGHDGILSGEAHERVQGKLTDVIAKSITPQVLAKGIANFHNTCAAYGITVVGALEGNGDSAEDKTTSLMVSLARHFDIGVRFYFQYIDQEKAEKFAKYQKHLRIGGCGDWEMDGSIGSHSAAFYGGYKDTGETAPCYYSQEKVNHAVKRADESGYQISSHAIGDRAIDRILEALASTTSGRLHRIEHYEFPTPEAIEKLKEMGCAVVMQPGYSWIDKRYLHSYEQFLPEGCVVQMKLKSLFDAGVCVCGSSDSPVQDMDPYLQMLGMVEFYNEEESISAYEAFQTYTVHGARAMQEEEEYGTLEVGKRADFFTANEDFFTLSPSQISKFRPIETYYGGIVYKKKKGTLRELAGMLLRRSKLV